MLLLGHAPINVYNTIAGVGYCASIFDVVTIVLLELAQNRHSTLDADCCGTGTFKILKLIREVRDRYSLAVRLFLLSRI